MNELIGMGVALVTPFNIDGTVDYKSLRSLVDIIFKMALTI